MRMRHLEIEGVYVEEGVPACHLRSLTCQVCLPPPIRYVCSCFIVHSFSPSKTHSNRANLCFNTKIGKTVFYLCSWMVVGCLMHIVEITYGRTDVPCTLAPVFCMWRQRRVVGGEVKWLVVHSHLESVKVQFNSRTNKKARAGVAVGTGVGSLNDKSLWSQKLCCF